MPTGTVKWFNNAKGFGFILPDEGNEDVFAHYSAIQMDGYRTLKAGQAVDFEISQGEKGLHAVNIRVISENASDSTSAPSVTEETNPSHSAESKSSSSDSKLPETEGV